MTKPINDKNFKEEVTDFKGIVVVDFWADWCMPCKRFAPVYEAISEKFANKAKFVKVDAEENQISAETMGIRGLPTVLIFKNGKQVDSLVGNQPAEAVERAIQKAIDLE